MSDAEVAVINSETRMTPSVPTMTTWRYLGDRDTADRAYCVRFGVQEAPEPTESRGGVLSYALPVVVPRK